MKFLRKPLGLYVHIPFCAKKCGYCDFYSTFSSFDLGQDYLHAAKREIEKWGGKTNRPIDTVYIGGGTPSLLGEKIIFLLDTVRQNFELTEDAEITAECNPSSDTTFLKFAKKAGVNRLSIGAQSGENSMLKLLGRTHTASDTVNYIKSARDFGFDNISADLMIALPSSNLDTLKKDIDFILSLNTEHISSYMLKIESSTAFSFRSDLDLPDDDSAAGQYLYMCDALKYAGYSHYEISNFAKEGKSSRHNLKYWKLEDYLGIGPSAHSMMDLKRFYYERDLKKFIRGCDTVFESDVDATTESVMLGLRLSEGVNLKNTYGSKALPIYEKLKKYENAGYLEINGDTVKLTDKGMLLSNSIITEIIYEDL